MADFIFPSSVDLEQINQELVPRLESAREIFNIFPTRSVDSHLLEWEQKDNYTGLQQVRGLNGMPSRVKPVSGKRYLFNPGTYGEFLAIDERQLTVRRQWGGFSTGINITDLVREAQDKLLQRRLDRLETIGWTLLSTGTFSVADGTSTLHTDAYTTQTFSAGVTWATAATATPLADLRAVQLKSRGYSVDFGARAKAYMNRSTLNAVLSNTNANDLGGRRLTGLVSINSLAQVNQLYAMDDLPTLVPYDRGYIDDTGTFQLYIPNNKVVVIGARTDNDPVGEYRFTRNANNADLGPGPYMRVIDRGEFVIPRSIEVHDGHNGGPILYHPAAIVIMTV